MPLLNLGSDRAFVKDAVNAPSKQDVFRLARVNRNIRTFAALIIASLLLLGLSVYDPYPGALLSVFCVGLWAALMGLYPAAWYDYSGQTYKQNLIVLGERVTAIVAVFMLAELYTGHRLQAAISAGLLFIRLGFILAQVVLWRRMEGDPGSAEGNMFPRFHSEGINLPVTVAIFSNALLTYGNQLFLNSRGETEIAAYGLAFQLLSPIFLFHGQALRLFQRQIAHACQSGTEILASVFKSAATLAGGALMLAVLIAVLMRFIPSLLADDRFSAMSDYSPILMTWSVFLGVGIVVTQHLIALGEEKFFVTVALLGGLVAILAGMWFIPRHGGIAVALILLCVHLVMISTNGIRLYVVASSSARSRVS